MKIYSLGEFINHISKDLQGFHPEEERSVREILERVKSDGDKALKEYTSIFDRAVLSTLTVSEAEIDQACRSVGADYIAALRKAGENIGEFHAKWLPPAGVTTRHEGVVMGVRREPLQRVGVYVPGGRAAYPSTVLMTVIPARIAGVREIFICTPPDPDGRVSPYTLAACREAGADAIYKVGGAQAVAALAFGTETIPAVDKIVGPGNIFVTIAKKMVFGLVGTDLPAGPSEVVIVADAHADPELIAADLLAQAEHDPLARAYCLTESQEMAEAVVEKAELFLHDQSRKEIIQESLERGGGVVLLPSLKEAWPLVDELAPEHVGLHLDDPWAALPKVKNAGAVFLGASTPQAAGDYGAGPNHVLPTGGTARFASPLGVEDFFKRSTLLYYSAEALAGESKYFETIARVEGLEAHVLALKLRRERYDHAKKNQGLERDCGDKDRP